MCVRDGGREGCTVAVTHRPCFKCIKSIQCNAVQCSAVQCSAIHIDIEIPFEGKKGKESMCCTPVLLS